MSYYFLCSQNNHSKNRRFFQSPALHHIKPPPSPMFGILPLASFQTCSIGFLSGAYGDKAIKCTRSSSPSFLREF